MKRFVSASSALLVAAMVVMYVGCGENTNSETEYSGTAIAMTANGEGLYDIDFEDPPHTVGLPPATGAGVLPRNTVTEVRFGNPIVVFADESETDQRLWFDDTQVCEACCLDLENGKCGDQIAMEVPEALQGGATYCTQAEVLISTEGTDQRFVILQDTPRVRNIEFRAGTISAANPDDRVNEWVEIGTYTRGEVIQVQSELDFVSGLEGTWTVWLNGSEVFSGPIIIVTGDSDGLDEVRFSTDVISDTEGTVAAADNIKISAGPCEPVNAPPVISVDQDPVIVDEGELAENTGTVSDEDGDTITLTASPIGDVTNYNDGTWSWSHTPSDGPAAWTVTITADDGNGGTAEAIFDLDVNNVAPVVGPIFVPSDPVNINDQPLVASADFYDPAGTEDEDYECTVDYGDGEGPQTGTVVDMSCTGPDQTYGAAGVYLVTVEVTDKDGGIGSATATEFIVIYDPSGGFVTGGGWIGSAAGAYVPDPSLAGKASFGFVSKYKKGASVPTGNTEFQFKVADLNFKSTSYQWLVITGADAAKFKGEGTINGEGSYKFMLWAGDGTPDTFRIRIWTEVEETGGENVTYDNVVDQALGGGSIVVHKAK